MRALHDLRWLKPAWARKSKEKRAWKPYQSIPNFPAGCRTDPCRNRMARAAL